MRRSTRAIIGTGKIASVAARSTIIMARRGENTDRSWAGRLPQGAGPASPPYPMGFVSYTPDNYVLFYKLNLAYC